MSSVAGKRTALVLGSSGQDGAYLCALLLERGVERRHDVAVDLFQGFDLAGRITFVRGFVRRFDVYTNNVCAAQGVNGVAALGGIVRIGVARSPGNFDAVPAD